MAGRSFIRDLERASHHVGARLGDRLHDLGITQAEAHVLALLADEGPLTVGSLGVAFGQRPSTLTSVLRRLEARDLIERHGNPADRRSFVIELSAGGAVAAARVKEEVAALERAVAGAVSPSALDGFFATTEAIAAASAGRPGTSSH
jgi:DNA-binding MarR family transcriptional regulator